MTPSPHPVPSPVFQPPGWGLAWRLAWRDLRGGLAANLRGLWVLIACLALGVFAIAAAGSLRAAVEAGMTRDATVLLGGDIDIRMTYRVLDNAQREALSRHGRLTDLREFRTTVRSGAGDAEQRAFSELKAVDPATYPLYGRVQLDPPLPLAEALRTETRADGSVLIGAVAEKGLLDRLGVEVGSEVTVGEARVLIRAVLVKEPDRVASVMAFGPRLLVGPGTIEASGLDLPGALIRNVTKLRIEDGSAVPALIADLNARFPEAGWDLRGVDAAAPGLDRFLGNITLFLTLVGLTALLSGGVGVANAVTAFMDSRRQTVAIFKTLGASGSLVFRISLLQILTLAWIGIGIGLLAGAVLPWGLGTVLADLLPTQMALGLYPLPLITAGAFGILVTLVFGLWPLAQAYRVPATALFRSLLAPASGWPRGRFAIGILLAVLALVAVTVLTADRKDIAAGFVVAAVLAVGVFRGMAALVMGLARRSVTKGVVVRNRPVLRLALTNLYRPGASTAPVVLSLGLGVSVLVASVLIQANLTRQVQEHLPETAPAYYFIDIQPRQLETFRQAVASVPQAQVLGAADMTRGRVVRLKDQPVTAESVSKESEWAVRGERALTSAAQAPADAVIVDGAWWAADHAGPPMVSVTADLAKGLGVTVGDRITLNVLGRDITATVANLRQVDWSSLSLNFAFIISPDALKGAPRTWIATVAAPPADELAVERAVGKALRNVSAIPVRQALQAVEQVMGAAAQAVWVTTALTVLAGVLVLASAIAAGHRRRVYDAVVLKVLGAPRMLLARAWLLEYGLIGGATALLAAAVGTGAAWVIVTRVMKLPWESMPGLTVTVSLACIVLTLTGGALGTLRALSEKPGRILRAE